MIVLSTFGSAAIDIDGHRLTPAADRMFAAVLYLSIERGRAVPRTVLQELIFPNAKNGPHSLRQLLYQLRKLGFEPGSDATHACVPPGDVDDPVTRATANGSVDEALLRGLTGGYLPGYAPAFSDTFVEWLETHRAAVGRSLLRTLGAQLTSSRTAGDGARTEAIARACLALDALHEEATLALAENLALSGAKSEAVGMLDRLLVELGTDAGSLKLPATVLRKRISERMPDPSSYREPPLIGRAAETSAIDAFIRSPDDNAPTLFILTGDPGMGKTRLLSYAEGVATLGGAATLRVTMQPHFVRRPMSVFSEAVPQLLKLPGALGCSPESMQFLRLLHDGNVDALAPDLRETDAEAQFARVLRAIDDVLDAITSETRLQLSIDDAHDLDPISARVLELIAGRRGARRLLIFAAARPQSEAVETLRRCERSTARTLPPLDPVSATALVEQTMTARGVTADAELIAWWNTAAAGNPLFLHNLITHFMRTGDRFAIPRSLSELLRKRIEGFSETRHLFFEACSVLGEHSNLTNIEYCTGLSVLDLHSSMRELEAAGLISVVGQLIQPVHRLLADAVLSETPSSVRLLLHRRAGEALEASRSSGPTSTTWSAASHWGTTGDDIRQSESLRACADQLLAIGRPSEASDLYCDAADMLTTPEEHASLLASATTAAYEASRWGMVLNLLRKRNIGQQPPVAGDDTSAQHYLLALDVHHQLGFDLTSSIPVLRHILADESLSTNTHLRAAKTLMIISDVMWLPDTAAFILGHISTLVATHQGDAHLAALIRLIYHSCYGSHATAVSLARELIADSANQQYSGQRLHHATNAAACMQYAGLVDEAHSLLRNAIRDLLSRQRFSTAHYLMHQQAALLLALVDHDQARDLVDSSKLLAMHAVDRGFSSGILSNEVILALHDRDVQRVVTLLHQSDSVPAVSVGRNKWIRDAYQLEVDMLRNQVDPVSVERLRNGHLIGRDYIGHDEIATALGKGLIAIDRAAEARALLRDYLTTHRRERSPVPNGLRELAGSVL